mmetsp:Transcript_22388/g.56985  ORF Transcript_22388/g.56985 Transcript_22388/m.56985 type:complete len:240 (-) Transcript_22388:1105-1824(-)
MGEHSDNVFLTSVVPALGAVISLAMYASPVQAVLAAQRSRQLGDLNPIPFAITVTNTIVWAVYGLIKHDPYVTAPNAMGVVVAVFCVLTSFSLASEQVRDRIRLLLCTEFAILSLLGVLTSFSAGTLKAQLGIWGMAGNVVTLIYYAAPLSTMAEVIRTRNSASILLPLCIMNMLNAALWTTYGVAMADGYIYVPNGIGLVLSLAQLALALVFPARPKPASSSPAAALHEARVFKAGAP